MQSDSVRAAGAHEEPSSSSGESHTGCVHITRDGHTHIGGVIKSPLGPLSRSASVSAAGAVELLPFSAGGNRNVSKCQAAGDLAPRPGLLGAGHGSPQPPQLDWIVGKSQTLEQKCDGG